MVREIKTTLALDGEKKFKEAMADAAREMRVIKADLKAVSAEFSATDDAQRYYAQRTDLLNRKVQQQSEIVEALSRAVKDSAAKYGDAAKETDGYRIKLSNATAELFKMRREAEDAARELEELGRDSDKIGRQIENGIGDAAEEVSESLDGMFAKVASDVNALKGSVAFQTTMNVGEFVMDGIQSVMGFVQENQEFNRRIAQTRSVVEMYGYNADEILRIAKDAASVTGDFENAQEALVNLAAAGFENEKQIEATVKNLLGIWLSAGGTLDFSGLAEDYLESVKDKTPTGTYAEAIIKFTDRSVEDVQKVLESMKSNSETLEAATAVLTEAGMQNVAEEYKRKNEEIVKAEEAAIDLATAAANLAIELQPAVTALVNGTTTVVNGLTEVLKILNDSEFAKEMLRRDQPEFADALESGQLDTFGGTVKYVWNQLFGSGSAGAEELESQWAIQGEKGAQAYWDSFGAAFESSEYADVYRNAFEQLGVNTSTTEAAEVGTATGQAVVDGLETATDNADIAGQNISTALGNGIAAAAPGALQNAMDLVNQMNDVLGMVAVPWYMSPATQFQVQAPSTGGPGGVAGLYIDGQRAGELLYDGVSTAGGRAVINTMLVK